MVQPKLTMKKEDVKLAISQYVLKHYQDIPIIGREKLDTIHHYYWNKCVFYN